MAGESSETYKTLDLALRIGELLLSSGAGAADVSAQMGNVARACGLRRVTADVTFTELAMSHQAAVDELTAAKVNKIVVLTHIGYQEDLRLAAQLRDVDLIVSSTSLFLSRPAAYPARAVLASSNPACGRMH